MPERAWLRHSQGWETWATALSMCQPQSILNPKSSGCGFWLIVYQLFFMAVNENLSQGRLMVSENTVHSGRDWLCHGRQFFHMTLIRKQRAGPDTGLAYNHQDPLLTCWESRIQTQEPVEAKAIHTTTG